MFDLITTGAVSYPKFIQIEGELKPRNYKVSEDAKHLINKLLMKDPGARLGTKGLNEIKKQSFFSGISFEDLKKKKAKAPIKPKIDKEDETNNFDEEFLSMEIEESPVGDWSKSSEYSNWFSGFDNTEMDDQEGGEPDNNTEGGDDD